MSVVMIATLVTLASVWVIHAIAQAVVNRIRVRWTIGPGIRASVLFVQGVAPTMIAAVVAVAIVLPAFLFFEPAHDGERAGFTLMMAAGLGGLHIARIAVRAIRMLQMTRGLTNGWRRTATPLDEAPWGVAAFAVDTGMPVVAVAGLVRPRLFVDTRILNACTPDEITAIAAHERAHVTRRDNLLRLLIGACAGPHSSAAIAWRRASEQAADASAADSPRRAVDLASALVKIARLAPAWSLDAAVISTIHDGGRLEDRVQHLLSIEASAHRRRIPVLYWFALLPITILLCIGWGSLLGPTYQSLELLVRHLP